MTTTTWRERGPIAAHHRIRSDALMSLVPAPSEAGVVLGDGSGRQTCELFAIDGPVRVVAAGSLALGQHVVMRAVGAGATITIRSERPHAWGRLVTAVALPRERIAVLPAGHDPEVEPTATRPHLLVDDAGGRHHRATSPAPAPRDGDDDGAASGRWLCEMRLIDVVTPVMRDDVRAADLVLVQPSAAEGVGLVAAARGAHELSDGRREFHNGLEVAVIRRHRADVAWLGLPENPLELS
ncbi:MAG: hypothetical protein ACRCYX_16290 [Dermatophilaceae bacterium]